MKQERKNLQVVIYHDIPEYLNEWDVLVVSCPKWK